MHVLSCGGGRQTNAFFQPHEHDKQQDYVVFTPIPWPQSPPPTRPPPPCLPPPLFHANWPGCLVQNCKTCPPSIYPVQIYLGCLVQNRTTCLTPTYPVQIYLGCLVQNLRFCFFSPGSLSKDKRVKFTSGKIGKFVSKPEKLHGVNPTCLSTQCRFTRDVSCKVLGFVSSPRAVCQKTNL